MNRVGGKGRKIRLWQSGRAKRRIVFLSWDGRAVHLWMKTHSTGEEKIDEGKGWKSSVMEIQRLREKLGSRA